MSDYVKLEEEIREMKQERENIFFTYCKNNFMLIGSRAIGVETESSDYDYVVTADVWELLEKQLNEEGFKVERGELSYEDTEFPMYNSDCVKVLLSDGRVINLIIYHESQDTLDEVFSTINNMLREVPINLRRNKKFRCKVYNVILSHTLKHRDYAKKEPSKKLF